MSAFELSGADPSLAPFSSAEILRSTAFFADVTPEQIGRVALLGRVETYPQDASVYTLGQAADDFYVLVDGMVRFTIGLGPRSTHAGQVLKRGEVFGWAALVESAHKRIATARAITPCTVLALNGEQLTIMMDEDHGLGYRLMRQLNELITGNLTAFAAG